MGRPMRPEKPRTSVRGVVTQEDTGEGRGKGGRLRRCPVDTMLRLSICSVDTILCLSKCSVETMLRVSKMLSKHNVVPEQMLGRNKREGKSGKEGCRATCVAKRGCPPNRKPRKDKVVLPGQRRVSTR